MRLARDPAVPLRGGAHLRADAWPAFATDTAPLAAAVLLTAAGASEIYDSLFANRFACAAGFAAMGAACTVRGRQLTLPGGAVLHGTDVTAPDLRGGAALLAAALAADGETRLRDPGHIPRGYEIYPPHCAGWGQRFPETFRGLPLTLHHRAGHARPLRGEPPRYTANHGSSASQIFHILMQSLSLSTKNPSAAAACVVQKGRAGRIFYEFLAKVLKLRENLLFL